MSSQEGLMLIQPIIPAAIGGTLGLLALLGVLELLKEATAAFKKGVRAWASKKDLNTNHEKEGKIMTLPKKQTEIDAPTCELPRKQQAIEAIFGLAWKKGKKYRPRWLIEELSSY